MRTLPLGLLVLFCACSSGQLPRIRVDPAEHWFLDPDGRVRLFHGVNSVEKGFPWYRASYMLNDTRLDHLQEWGMNVVRLGSMWSGVEPNEDQFNDTYVEIINEIVDKLAQRGIYTILDMHQDVMSTKYMSYDGVPLWLVDKYPEPENPYPWPLEQVNAWEQGYLTQACSEGFQSFYDNHNNSLYEWADMWGHLAKNFTGNSNIFGYDLMNEPWIGDYIDNFNLSLPGYSAHLHLVPAYEIVNDAIREHDSEGLVLYEPMIYGQLREEPVRGSGFMEVPGGDFYQNVSAYSFHAYCWPIEFLPENYTDDDIQERADYCKTDFLPEMYSSGFSSVNRTGGGLILTEFGLCKTWEDRVDMECDVFMNTADDFLLSWTEWDYNDHGFYDDNEDYILGKVYYYARPYARATAGTPLSMTWNSTTLEFNFSYIIDADITAATEIFVPQFHYSCGFDMEMSGNVVSKSGGVDLVYLQPVSSNTDGETATFSLSPTAGCS